MSEHRMVRCPFTGKMIPFEPRPVAAPLKEGKVGPTDMINPQPMLPLIAATRQEELTEELAVLRRRWVELGSNKRAGKPGDTLMKKFRRLALEYWHVTGNHPAALDADM